MKPVTPLVVFSLLLCIQLINGQSFHTLVEKLEENAKATKQKIKQDLSFILNISPNYFNIWTSFTEAVPTFLALDVMENMLVKVPEDMLSGEYYAKDVLRYQISGVIVQQSQEIATLYNEICTAFGYDLTQAKKSKFAEYYWAWYQNIPNKNDVKRIKNGIDAMSSDHDTVLAQFNGRMEKIDYLRNLISTCSSLVNSNLRKLITSKKRDSMIKYSQEIVDATLKASSVQPKLIKRLTEVKKILMNYNKRRTRWAEYIIDMRESPLPARGEQSDPTDELDFGNLNLEDGNSSSRR
ncbi:uncharacterized protein LOC116344358 [Contarinia nasturtii]|uniref:uncharacterized protein LOC116344358 n=1 Tax=Contarinia nasturtii TaxID=265458 RepID=UPI0012D4A626|nr:uncharacterized protein LOC116344358 [Contarinia nasturtii]